MSRFSEIKLSHGGMGIHRPATHVEMELIEDRAYLIGLVERMRPSVAYHYSHEYHSAQTTHDRERVASLASILEETK